MVCSDDARPDGVNVGCERDDLDAGPERTKTSHCVRRHCNDDDAARLQCFECSGCQTMLGVGILPADGKTAIVFDVAKNPARNADVFRIMFTFARLHACGKFDPRVASIAASSRGDQEIFAARRSSREQHQQTVWI
jgi:hypothetical protein